MRVKYASETVTSQACTLHVRCRVTPPIPTADVTNTSLGNTDILPGISSSQETY